VIAAEWKQLAVKCDIAAQNPQLSKDEVGILLNEFLQIRNKKAAEVAVSINKDQSQAMIVSSGTTMSDKSFRCPVNGCGKIYAEISSLDFHIFKNHSSGPPSLGNQENHHEPGSDEKDSDAMDIDDL
jgi:hypothetical protein